MTKQIFQRHFPDLDLIDKTHTYDTDDGLDAAINAVLSELRAVGGDDDMRSALEEILTAIEGAVCSLIALIMPDSGQTDQVLYAVQNTSLLPVSATEQIESLQSEKQEGDTWFRVTNLILERDIQAVVDCLTADRITEELDAPTFVERLRGAFHRLRGFAASMELPFDELQNRSKKILSRLSILEKILGALQSEISPELSSQIPANGQAINATTSLTANAKRFAEHFGTFVSQSAQGVSRIKDDICSDANIAGAEGESVLVSREAERHALFRPAPIFWAICITFLAKLVLAHNTSETLHGLAIPILIGTALLTWISSISFGIWNRKRRMRDLQKHIRQQFRQVLQDPKNTDELIEFPPIGSDHAAPNAVPIQAYAYRGKIKFHRMRVAALNLWALAIPLVLLVFVLITRTSEEQRFIARFDGSAPCSLAEGRLVFASKASFFVLPQDRNDTVWKKALSHAFPEILADVVPRENIFSVKDATDETQLLECAVADPDRNSYTVTHTGDPLTILSQQSDVTSLAIKLDNLVTALSSGAPFEINLESGFATDGISLELGDQSLSEIRALRLSSQTSNDLAQTFLSAFEANALNQNEILSNQLTALIEGQQQVLKSIAASSSETIVVSPTMHTVFDPTAPTATSANIFQTLIQIDGEITELENLGNALVLPVFTEPVTNGTGDLNTAEGAFAWGQDVTRLRDVEVRNDGTTYFDRIAQTLEACLAEDAIIEIDVLGLASQSWDGIEDDALNSALNYHLAEGRRIGALSKIVEGISDASVLSRIQVQTSEGFLSLNSIQSFLDTDPTVENTLAYLGRFDDAAAFDRRRNTLLDISGLNDSEENPLEELFARSVLLQVIGTDGGPCAFLTK